MRGAVLGSLLGWVAVVVVVAQQGQDEATNTQALTDSTDSQQHNDQANTGKVEIKVSGDQGQEKLETQEPQQNQETETQNEAQDTGTRGAPSENTAGQDKQTSEDSIAKLGDKDRFFLGRYSSTTETAVVMVTSTVFFSCLSGTSAAVCMGRRRKRAFRSNISMDDSDGNAGTELEGSKTDPPNVTTESPSEPKDKNNEKILGFQVWTRVRTTTTVTMLFTDTNTTIRLSYFCQAGLAQLPAFNCVG